MTGVLEIPIQPHGQGHTVIAANDHPAGLGLDLKNILTVLLRDLLKFKGIPVLVGWEQPLQQASCSGHRRILGTAHHGCTANKQKAK